MRPDRLIVTEAGEWRVQRQLEAWAALTGVPVEIRDDDALRDARAVRGVGVRRRMWRMETSTARCAARTPS